MTIQEFEAWWTLTESSKTLWTEDAVISHNQKCSFYYIGGEDGAYMKIGKDGSFEAGKYTGAFPHIGEASFERLANEQYPDYNGAFDRALKVGGKKFLVDMFSSAEHMAVELAVKNAYESAEPQPPNGPTKAPEMGGDEPVTLMNAESKIVFIASPYAGNVDRNAEFAREACRYCIEQGFVPIAPHLMYPQILDNNDPEQRALGLELATRLLSVCDELWLCGERISDGMYSEMLDAMSLKIPHRRVFPEEILQERTEIEATGMEAIHL